MDTYDITKVNIFSLQNLKRGELANFVSVLVFLYSKFHGSDEISFKYSEIDWLYYHNVSKIITRLGELNLLTIVQKPSKQAPFIVKIKPNSELHYILNKDRAISFHKFEASSFTRQHFMDAIDCTNLTEHFIGATVSSWVRNINSGAWDLYKFLTITKIISYFSCDYKVKTYTVNKYVSKKTPFTKAVTFLYDKVPNNRKEILYSQFLNALAERNLSHDKSFCGMVLAYLESIDK